MIVIAANSGCAWSPIGDVTAIMLWMQGNVTASAILTMDGESVLVGDIGAARATINGRVKGNVTTREAAVFNQNAMLLGDVTSELVTIDQGAVIHGALKVLRDKEIEKAFENL